jgi:Ni,Fe-hydrogenase I cytochrome b subunit
MLCMMLSAFCLPLDNRFGSNVGAMTKQQLAWFFFLCISHLMYLRFLHHVGLWALLTAVQA